MEAQKLSLKENKELQIYYSVLSRKMSILDLEALLYQTQKMKELMINLQQPWRRYIPILHKSFMLYNSQVSEVKARNRTIQSSMNIIRLASDLSIMNSFVAGMMNFYVDQERDLKMLISNIKR